MKINWKVRFKNPTWLTMFISLIISFTFNVLSMFDIIPVFTKNQAMELVSQVLTFLGLIGVLVDPTTSGISDSQRALNYSAPWNDDAETEQENS